MTTDDDRPEAARGRCPTCGKPSSATERPFCSRRCADVDLARWFGGTYVIPGGAVDADEDGDGGEVDRQLSSGDEPRDGGQSNLGREKRHADD